MVREMGVGVKDDGGGGEEWCVWCPLTLSLTPRFDEAGYIAIPDCLWGSPEQGLEPPLNLTGVPLFILKTANASRGHYGEMAGGQPFCLE